MSVLQWATERIARDHMVELRTCEWCQEKQDIFKCKKHAQPGRMYWKCMWCGHLHLWKNSVNNPCQVSKTQTTIRKVA